MNPDQKYRTLFETMDQGFCIVQMIFDEDNRPVDYLFLETNQVFEQQTGLKDATGKTALELVPTLEQHWFDTYGNVALTGEAIRFVQGSEPMKRWFEVYAFRIGPEADRNIAIIFTDISERKASEEALRKSESRFQSLVKQASSAIVVVTGEEMKVEIVNDAYGRLIDRTPEELLGKPLFSVIPETEEYYYPILLKVMQTGENLYLHDSPYSVARDGKVIEGFLHVVYEPYRDVAGNIIGVMAILQDVTESVRSRKALEESEKRYRLLSHSLEQQVSQRTAELRRSNNDLEQFAHVASHDLQEPMRKIKLFSDRLREQLGDSSNNEVKSFLEKINHAAHRMTSMIEGVLKYSSINAYHQELQIIDLNEVIENILADLEVAIDQHQANVQFERLPSIQGVPVLIYQLFYNLINNSIKFVRRGIVPEIAITSQPVTKDGKDYLEVKLTDNGIGFSAAQSGKIFDTFTRLHSKDEYEGTGLGLALCKKIVDRHGGEIWASGKPGKGAEFTVLLPAG